MWCPISGSQRSPVAQVVGIFSGGCSPTGGPLCGDVRGRRGGTWLGGSEKGAEVMVRYKTFARFPRKELPSGKRLHTCGTSPCLMGKITISMVIFNGYVTNHQRVDSTVVQGGNEPVPWQWSTM